MKHNLKKNMDKIKYKSTKSAIKILAKPDRKVSLFHGNALSLLKKLPDESVDLTISSPPYCMDKEYEESSDIEQFIKAHKKILPEIVRITKPGGSICWQVGFHVDDGVVNPLDYLVHDLLKNVDDIYLRNRIVWHFGHGLHCSNRFSGRYEVILWYTKGKKYYFDLDAVRVPQMYPGKRHAKGPLKGEFSGNPKGKNPSDIWEIPNVKANHIEKTEHPCQFPVALAQRVIRALSKKGGLVLDPFAGVSSAGVAALIEGRRFLGAELESKYITIAESRLRAALEGSAKIRPLSREIYKPGPTEKVAMKPEHFWKDIEALINNPEEVITPQ
jgi:adenine-specific DNA-methyltransferase